MKARALLAAAPGLVLLACSLSLDGFTDGDAPTDGGPEGTTTEIGTDAPAPVDAGSGDSADADAAPLLGCQGAVACERVVFVTHDTWSTSQFGSISGADDLCNQAANAPGATPRVKGHKFRAWLSASASDVASRLVHGTAHYIRADGAVIANTFSTFVSGALLVNFDVDETGHDLAAPDIAWTGTMTDGTHDDMLCDEWTSALSTVYGKTGFTSVFDIDASPAGWTFGDDTPCDVRAHLYCLEY